MASSTDGAAKAGPDYGKAAGAGAGAGVVGAGVAAAMKLGVPMIAGAGVVGFLAVFMPMMMVYAAKDTKRLGEEASVRKKQQEAYAHQSFGRLDKAERALQEALTTARGLGNKHVLTLTTLHSLGNLYRLQKKLDKAEQFYREAVPIYDSLGNANDMSQAQCLRDFSLTLEALGKHEEALSSAGKAHGIFQFLHAEQDLADNQELMARCHAALGQRKEAIDLYLKVKDSKTRRLGENHSQVIFVLLTLARLYRQEQMLNEALDLYKDILKRLKAADKPRRLNEAEALVELAELRLLQAQPKDVEPLVTMALKLLQQYVGPIEVLLQRIWSLYKDAREKLNLGVKENDMIYLFSLERDKVRDVLKENLEYVNLKDKTGWGPLQWACFLGREDLSRWLLRNGSKPDNYEAATTMGPIHVAAAWSKMSAVVNILEAGQDIDSKGPANWTPLFFAASLGKQETLEQLVVRGANVKAKDNEGRIPLHVAAEAGHLEAVLYLLDKSDKNAKEDKLGRTALHMAALEGHGPVVEALVNNQAELSATDKNGKTPIQLAEEAGHKMLVTALKHAQAP